MRITKIPPTGISKEINTSHRDRIAQRDRRLKLGRIAIYHPPLSGLDSKRSGVGQPRGTVSAAGRGKTKLIAVSSIDSVLGGNNVYPSRCIRARGVGVSSATALGLPRIGSSNEAPDGLTMRSIPSVGFSFVRFCADLEFGCGKVNVNSAAGGWKISTAGSASRSSVVIGMQ